jgi:predicted DCC family thiol-disulfide oxidoreductase YuxK
MRRFVKLFARLYDVQVSAVPLAVFRIAFAFVGLLELRNIYALRAFMFDEVPGVVRAHWSVPLLLWAWAVALACLLVGYRTRVAAAANYASAVGFVGYYAMRHGFDWHFDSGLLTGSLMLVIAPSARALSMDRLLARGAAAARGTPIPGPATVSFVYTVFPILALGLMYWDSMLWKATSPMYRHGLGFWLPASLPQNTFFDISPLLGPELLMRMMGYGVLLFEGTFLFLVWFRRLRFPLVLAGMGFHAGIMVAYPIPLFSLQMIAFYLAVVPPDVYAALARRIRRARQEVSVYYDAMCPLCRRTAALFTALDVRGGVRWLPFQDHAAAEPALRGVPDGRLIEQLHVVDADGRIQAGVGAYAVILRAMGWPRPIGWLLRVPPVRTSACAVYDRVAARRHRDGGRTDVGRALSATASREFAVPDGLPYLPARASAGALLALWLLSVGVIAFVSPFAEQHLPLDPSLVQRVQSYARRYKDLVYPLTGFSQHGVFMDSHFRGYTSETMLVLRQGEKETLVPFILPSGEVGPYNWGRSWVLWTFRAVHPGLARDSVQRSVARWVAYWASREMVDIRQGELQIRRRHLDVSLDRWQPHMGERNRGQRWWIVGRVTGPARNLRIEWFRDSMLVTPQVVTK